jgi:hypothetical protein
MNFNYHHDAPTIPEGLGVDQETQTRAMEIVFFTTISNYLIASEFYDTFDEAPQKLKTMTGDIEASINLVSSTVEKDFMLLMFKNYHEIAINALAHYKFLSKADENEKRKFEIFMKIAELKAQDEIKDGNVYTKPEYMMKRIEEVRNSNFNFEKYYAACQNLQHV